LAGWRVLVVEDNQVNQVVIRGLLERTGCRVTLAANGVEALAALAREFFNLVLMDCEMPILDGLSATRALREREGEQGGGRHQVVIALTAHASPAERDRCLAAGMDDYLAKPIRAPDLLATLGRWWAPPVLEAPPAPRPSVPAVTAPAAAAPAVDASVIADLREAVGEIRDIIETCLKDLPLRLAELRAGLAAGDVQRVSAVAHGLAGVMGTLGARGLMRHASALNAKAKAGDLTEAADLVAAIEAEANRATRELADQLDPNGAGGAQKTTGP
jgi:two-component system, sensor histidine kinase and response regulator